MNQQISIFPSESSGLTEEVRFQVIPPVNVSDSIFDYDQGRDQFIFSLKVTGGLNSNKVDQVNFTIDLKVKNEKE